MSKLEGPLATLVSPGSQGGTNWPGGSYDPETHIVYVFSQSAIAPLGLVPPPRSEVSDMNYIQGTPRRARGSAGARRRLRRRGAGGAARGGGRRRRRRRGLTVQGLPLLKPPYGRITAIDLNKGEIVWQIAHGETPDNIRNNPALKGLNIPRTGRPGLLGPLVTKTLVICRRGRLLHHAVRAARRDAARLRQGDRQGSRRGLHAGAAERLADDLHAERQAVHRGRDQRRGTTPASWSRSSCRRLDWQAGGLPYYTGALEVFFI